MSAYMMTDDEIRTIALAGALVSIDCGISEVHELIKTAKHFAEHLHFSNARALLALYGDPIPAFTWAMPSAPRSMEWLADKVREYRYQACDDPSWSSDGYCVAWNVCHMLGTHLAQRMAA